MILVSLRDISKHYGPEAVLDGLCCDIRPGERIGLVGPNGTGKTTLLRILAGLEEADRGHVERHPNVRIGYLQQQPEFSAGRTVREEAMEALSHLAAMAHDAERLADALSEAEEPGERKQLAQRFDDLQLQLQQRDAYHLDHKVERVLCGLGLPEATWQQPTHHLSGGQQNRLLLAKLLLEDADLLLLDEPSNHLDLDATQWLEDYLAAARPALVVVSHDRFFLDKVTNRTLELLQGTVDDYTGNFSAYVRQKAERLQVQQRTYEKQQAEIARLQDFVRRHHYGQKHAQAEDRRKRLERIEPVAPPRVIKTPPMQFTPAGRAGDIVLRAERLTKGFDQTLFEDVTFDILRGEKWAVLGPNGSGKTTLVRCLLGHIPPDAGRVVRGVGLQVGYFDQHLQCLDSNTQVVDAIRPDHKEFFEAARRSLLARFGITGDMAFQPVGALSGGERNRAALAYLAALDANLLVLDEPTNHLDLWAREALQEALRQFDGTVLLVSHDRYFLNRVADHLLVVQDGQCSVIEGNYDTYLHLVRQGLVAHEPTAKAGQSAGSGDGAAKRAEPSRPTRKRRKFPYRKAADIEADIHACERRIEQLHQQLGSPDVVRDGQRVKEATAELLEQQQQLEQLYEHWEEACERN